MGYVNPHVKPDTPQTGKILCEIFGSNGLRKDIISITVGSLIYKTNSSSGRRSLSFSVSQRTVSKI
jgi:hypothetical protein